VDHDYKVLCVHVLRVIDGSTFNASPGTNMRVQILFFGGERQRRIVPLS
jgi:choline dehydrogenase